MDRDDPTAIAFRRAVEARDADALRALFVEHPETSEVIDAPWFSFGSTALSEAAGYRDRALLDALLDLGADTEVMSEWENGPYSALHRLVDGATPESLELAEHLLSRGAAFDIHTASGLGRLDRIREILSAEPGRVSEPGPDGATPLHLARSPEVAALLLDLGAEIDKLCIDHSSTAAMWAAGGREGVMRYLVEHGARPDLYMAVLLDDIALAERILETEPTAIDVRVSFGHSHEHLRFGDKYVWALNGADTPLELARLRDKPAIYAFLLQRSPPAAQLLQASRRGDAEAMTALLSGDTSLLADLDEERVCEMLYAGANGARVALEHGADPDARDRGSGATALHHAAWRGLADVARALLSAGADSRLRDRSYDATPLGWANEDNQRGMMDLLLAHQPADIVDAAWMGNADRVREVLTEDPSLVDGFDGGRVSPLRRAAWTGHADVVRVLIEHGADPTIPSPSGGKTALDLARERNHADVVRILSDL